MYASLSRHKIVLNYSQLRSIFPLLYLKSTRLEFLILVFRNCAILFHSAPAVASAITSQSTNRDSLCSHPQKNRESSCTDAEWRLT